MSGNILIIDDSPIDRKMIRSVLENRLNDMVIYDSENSDGVLSLLIEKNISVCILDIIMPGKNGFELLNEIKNNKDTVDIPVVICTSLTQASDIETALTLGAYDYFTKPLSEEAMKISLPLKIKNAVDLKHRSDTIIHLSYHDKLTGLYNRRYFEEEISRLVSPDQLPLSFIVGDVNGLKMANDAYGHEIGDHLLIILTKILANVTRENDSIFRIGGDEFAIIMPNTTSAEAEQIIADIHSRCTAEPEDPIKPSISLGCATKERPEQKINDIYRLAEENMYCHKLKTSKNVKDSIILALRNKLKDLNHEPD